jgi:hypothetical protein
MEEFGGGSKSISSIYKFDVTGFFRRVLAAGFSASCCAAQRILLSAAKLADLKELLQAW